MIQFLNAATGTASTAEMLLSFLPMILIIVFMIVLIYLPQKRQDKKDAAMRSSIEIGDKVTTIGGIVGIVCAIADKDDTIVIETSDDRVRMELTKWAVSTTGVQSSGEEKSSKEEKGPSFFLTSRTACTKPSPTFLIPRSPKQTPFSVAVKPFSLSLMSGGSIGIFFFSK